ncbi:MAG TPA: hypothetical protein VHR36_09680 [Pyrinomonadaceae bacterium]|nr:hypothetical protein [Pyrinomonadaceae bacterium]
MKTIGCNNVRREIEEAASGEILAAPARDHLRTCGACASFGKEQQQLKEMVASLAGVEAPADFDFKLRARLAASRPARREFAGNGFGMRSIAFATLVLLFGVAVVVLNMRSRGNESTPVASVPTAPASDQASQINKNSPAVETSSGSPNVAAIVPVQDVPVGIQESSRTGNRNQRSSTPQFIARNARVKATDLSASAAPVFRPDIELGSSVFPLGTSNQSLKVSVDDGRGTSRTISLPTVSFGSSRVLAQNPAPVMVSTRDSW